MKIKIVDYLTDFINPIVLENIKYGFNDRGELIIKFNSPRHKYLKFNVSFTYELNKAYCDINIEEFEYESEKYSFLSILNGFWFCLSTFTIPKRYLFKSFNVPKNLVTLRIDLENEEEKEIITSNYRIQGRSGSEKVIRFLKDNDSFNEVGEINFEKEINELSS